MINSARAKLLNLVTDGHFTHESLLIEIVCGMSGDEAEEMLEWICDEHDIYKTEEAE